MLNRRIDKSSINFFQKLKKILGVDPYYTSLVHRMGYGMTVDDKRSRDYVGISWSTIAIVMLKMGTDRTIKKMQMMIEHIKMSKLYLI